MLLLLSQAGFANELVTLNNKYRACQCIIIRFVFKTRREELQQLRVGLESISLLQFLKMCESCVTYIFPSAKEVKVKSADFLRLIDKSWLQNLVGTEDAAMAWFTQYVIEIENANSGEACSMSKLYSHNLCQLCIGFVRFRFDCQCCLLTKNACT